jgi:hypothetical protein
MQIITRATPFFTPYQQPATPLAGSTTPRSPVSVEPSSPLPDMMDEFWTSKGV